MLTTVLIVLFIPVCILLILIVLLQAGKGGGLAGAFGGPGSQAFLGARGTADFLSKFTIYLAIAFISMAFLLSVTYGRGKTVSIKEEKPATPAEQPATTTSDQTNQQATPAAEGKK